MPAHFMIGEQYNITAQLPKESMAARGERLASARVRVAAIDAATFRPRGLPDALYEQFKSLESNAE